MRDDLQRRYLAQWYEVKRQESPNGERCQRRGESLACLEHCLPGAAGAHARHENGGESLEAFAVGRIETGKLGAVDIEYP
jgi:hypothetical protein